MPGRYPSSEAHEVAVLPLNADQGQLRGSLTCLLRQKQDEKSLRRTTSLSHQDYCLHMQEDAAQQEALIPLGNCHSNGVATWSKSPALLGRVCCP